MLLRNSYCMMLLYSFYYYDAVDGGYSMINTFLIRPRFWKKVAQLDRIIEDALYLSKQKLSAFSLSPNILCLTNKARLENWSNFLTVHFSLVVRYSENYVVVFHRKKYRHVSLHRKMRDDATKETWGKASHK